MPELRLDNPLLYGESASGDTFWTKFDPEGLSAYGDLWDYVGDQGMKGNYARSFGAAFVGTAWNAFSFGSAAKNGTAGDKYDRGEITGKQFAGELTANTAVAVAKGAVVYGTGGLAGAGTSVAAAMTVGAGTGAVVETLDVANDRGNAAIEGNEYRGTVGSDLLKVARGAETGALLAGVFQVGANSVRAGMEGYAQASLPEFDGTTTTNMVTDQLEYVTVTNTPRPGGVRHPYTMADGHSETNAASELNDLRGNNATAFHNNPEGTCPNCDRLTGGFLKPGKRLLVVPPSNAVPRTRLWNTNPKWHENTGKSAYE